MRALVGAMMWCGLAAGVNAATFTVIEEAHSGQWSAVLFENDNGGRGFCALQSIAQNPVFRINSYLGSGDTFLEIFDANWTKPEGDARFSLAFTGAASGPSTMALAGESWGDSYTYDIVEKKTLAKLQGLLASATALRVTAADGTELAAYALDGSAEALRRFEVCVRR